ncbi:3-hydroxyacyl-CoA dehydrogenase [Pseudooceanicola nanhaiensis]|jgi:NAD(P)-dependent dehydrogenase (short-subunit alcohol dehydrogenase family)|uniref:3-hydroxyacyl-CoA dehydrogenase n=2 Tax=Pseudooceanicola nanhaiensis TaxID=375761 RepID=A0A917SYM6_9RHOB|nr:SDR family NAD(P)-dependent oxidoreductase [Pseudooceanicola nanhaiensis]GGM01486.1 3-hydroxyacyl-CoA dehydrogenase [Pseudooceanicola nanhaiensis]
MDITDGIGAIVTGGGSGLGAATARHLASLGAKVGVLDFNAEGAREVADEIGGLALHVNVADEAQVETAFAEYIDWAGSAPRIVNSCAGIGTAARVVNRDGDLSIDKFRRTLEVNLVGTYIVMSNAIKAMSSLEPLGRDGERGVVINTSSVAYQDGQLGQAAYAASKGGVASLSLPVARETARSGIRIMAIAPGLFATAMAAGLPEDIQKGIEANIPFPPRFGDAEDYALMVEQIVRNKMLNGSTIRLDGAVRLPPR